MNDQERMGMLIDVSRCIGCRGCQVACKQWNQLKAEKTRFTGTYQNPPRLSGNTFTLVTFKEIAGANPGDPPRWLFRKEQCHHCGQAACLEVCPTGAIKRDPAGMVHIDQAVCAGCKYCVETCPFQVPHPSRETGTARKCTMCRDRVANGLNPACATACPTGAVEFGKWDEMLALAKTRKKALDADGGSARIYGETELGGLGTLYLLPETASLYGLPDNPQLPHWPIIHKWLLGLIPGLAIMYAMWHRMSRENAVKVGAEEKPEASDKAAVKAEDKSAGNKTQTKTGGK